MDNLTFFQPWIKLQIFVYFSVYDFRRQARGQKILTSTVATTPWMRSAINIFITALLTCETFTWGLLSVSIFRFSLAFWWRDMNIHDVKKKELQALKVCSTHLNEQKFPATVCPELNVCSDMGQYRIWLDTRITVQYALRGQCASCTFLYLLLHVLWPLQKQTLVSLSRRKVTSKKMVDLSQGMRHRAKG
jgi:hypothetical protein